MEKKIKYLIVEDEEKSRETLLKKISLCNFLNIECMGLAANATEAMFLSKMNRPDFLLLDINLPGKDGFELLTDMRKEGIEPAVILTSAHTENHILLNALRHAPANYLVKPIDIDELETAIHKLCEQINNTVKQKTAMAGKVRFQNCYGPIFLNQEQIMAIKAEQHYSILTLNNGEAVMLLQSIANIEREANLAFPPFFKADRSTILNLNFVESIHVKKNECILRNNDNKVIISIANIRISDLISKLDSFNNGE